MPYRKVPFVNGGHYHIFNRGINRQETFLSPRDYKHFLETVFYYSIKNPKPKFSQYSETQLFPINRQKKIVDVLCYCLMPNHFHLLVRQVEEGGVSELMRKSIHSYTKYRNTRLNILGGVFQPIFKAVRVESDEQLLHLSRYIHLNPIVSLLARDLNYYPWSSYSYYATKENNLDIKTDEILGFFKSPTEYDTFLRDHTGYTRTLESITHSILE